MAFRNALLDPRFELCFRNSKFLDQQIAKNLAGTAKMHSVSPQFANLYVGGVHSRLDLRKLAIVLVDLQLLREIPEKTDQVHEEVSK